MSDYEDQVPFLNSPSSCQQGQGSQGSCDYDYDNPFYRGSESEESMEDGGANDGSHHSRQEEVIEPPPTSPAGKSRTGSGDQEEKRSHNPKTSGDHGSTKSDGSRTLKSQNDPFVSIKDAKKHKNNLEAFTAFIGHPNKYDPAHVQLRETGWAMANQVFHPQNADKWPTMKANDQTSHSDSSSEERVSE